MVGVLVAFAVIGVAIGAGYLAAVLKLVTVEQGPILNRVAFYVFAPALLFSVLSRTPADRLVSPVLGVVLIASLVTGGLFVAASRIWFKRDLGATTLGITSSVYVNSNNIGLPVSVFVIGDLRYFAPLLVVQIVAFLPLIFISLQIATNKGSSFTQAARATLLNPLIIGSVLGLLVSLTRVDLPELVMKPLENLGAATVPVLLFSYGVSLFGQTLFHKNGDRWLSISAIILKAVVMPAIAFVFAKFIFGLSRHEVFAAVILASLPTAQNIFTYATVYKTEVYAVRDVVFVTTIVSLPIMFLIAALLTA